MTEAVILELIALAEMIVFSTSSIILVKTILKMAPSRFMFWTGYGHIEVSFNQKADE